MPGVTVNYSLGNAKDPKHRYKINIMDAMKYWVSGEYDYRQGIVLRAPDSVENGTTELYKTFGSYQHADYKPSLVITYLDHEQNCEPYGYLDAVESTNIRGWAWCIDAPNTPVRVKLYLENQTTGEPRDTKTVEATTYRPDVQSAGYGTGKYGFRYNIDWNKYSAGRYKVTAKALSMNGTTTEYILNNGTKYYENTGVKVSEQSLELGLGDTANLTATTYINGTAGWAVTWSSSNTSVATVDGNGKVTAVGVGTAIITVTNGSSSASCTVVVNPPNTFDIYRVGAFVTPESQGALASYEHSVNSYNSIPWSFEYEAYYTAAMVTAQGGAAMGMPDAAQLLRYFLMGLGETQTINFNRMLIENTKATDNMAEDINRSLSAAEYFLQYYNNNVVFTTASEQSHNTSYGSSALNATNNWYQAIHGYRTWNSCTASKNGNSYSMTVNYNMRDFYDWEPTSTKDAPIVSQQQMYTLHCAGMAKDFKVEGNVTLTVSWTIGQRLGTGATLSFQ